MKITDETVAVVTGGASGIGLGLAAGVVARGGTVVISDVRASALPPALAELRGLGGTAMGLAVDVTDPGAMHRLAATVVDRYGRVDLVCNNAGLVSPAAPTWEQSLETWRRMIEVKIIGVVNGIRAFAPLLVDRGAGHILNTASSGGLAPLPDRSPYTTTMHAIVGLTETLEVELKSRSSALGATVLCPGLVDTPLGHNSETLGAVTLAAGAPRSMRDLVPDILSPHQVAEAAFAAIEAGLVHVAPGSDVLGRARSRVDRLLADLTATPH